MAITRGNTRPRYRGAGVGFFWDQVRHRLRSGPVSNWRLVGPVPARIVLSPPCLRPSDPLLARDFYQGRFTFAGRTVETTGESPFAVEPPSHDWMAELHSFRWLRHLSEAGSDLSAAQARALIDDWVGLHGKRLREPPYEVGVVASRLTAWLQHAGFFLQNSEHGFYRRFMGMLARQVRYLNATLRGHPESVEHLQATAALALASLALPTPEGRQQRAASQLEAQLKRQILADGAHVSRNPAHLPELLVDLMPLAQCYVAASRPVPPELMRAIDRMFPRLRAMRHVDGHLAHFHGAGFSKMDLLARVLRLDRTAGRSGAQAVQSGFYRLDSGGSVVIADIGTVPRGIDGAGCHASALAFEFSSSRSRIVVNLGTDRLGRDDYDAIARATAAHSTLSIGNQSSARFKRFGGGSQRQSLRCIAGPGFIDVAEWTSNGMSGFQARHDGYVPAFGLVHERGIVMSPDGGRVDGYDRLEPMGALTPPAAAAQVRFHLHPSVDVEAAEDNRGIILSTDSSEKWLFRVNGTSFAVEESLYLAAVAGPVPTSQIVVNMGFPDLDRISWRFERIAQ
ncbi:MULTISPECIES: heparinase II/III family protein [unclassified Roseitalea]|uniref:heparinase II/III family protein n=1 Tax=unclassified Roseitalea TaxID=2639107 RepID=UPI00273FB13C|nr:MULTISPECIES: heparinase II/III family protein [unclassified Roseitalea]